MKALLALVLLGSLAGCMTYEQGRMGPLGSTVNSVVYLQIADKERAANPGTDISAAGVDGALTERVMDNMRGVTGDANQVAQPIQINVGN